MTTYYEWLTTARGYSDATACGYVARINTLTHAGLTNTDLCRGTAADAVDTYRIAIRRIALSRNYRIALGVAVSHYRTYLKNHPEADIAPRRKQRRTPK